MIDQRPAPVQARIRRIVVALLLGACAGTLDAATQFDLYDFPTPGHEARYRELIAELRCPKCLNTNLAGSDAPIAQDLRRTVHRMIVADGRSDDEVRAFLQERYGDFVLYDPPFRPDTWVLWFAPPVFLLLGAVVLLRLLRRPPASPLSDTEAERLRSLLERD
jgi:cytochrome c-type biogenesis protein CcmH